MVENEYLLFLILANIIFLLKNFCENYKIKEFLVLYTMINEYC